MRFAVTGEWRTNSMLRLVIGFFLLFAIMLWVSNLLMFMAQLSFDPAKIAEHYLGVKTEFAEPMKRPYKVMLQVTHGHILGVGLMVLTLAHMVLFVPGRATWKLPLISLTFLSAIANEGSSWLIRYYGAGWAKFKIAMFCLFQLCLGTVIVLIALALVLGWRNAYRGSKSSAHPPSDKPEARPAPPDAA